eukprot:UN01916
MGRIPPYCSKNHGKKIPPNFLKNKNFPYFSNWKNPPDFRES